VARAALRAQRIAPHLAAERAFGASGFRVALRGALRDSIGPTVTCAALLIGPAILCETSLSFLGLGVQPPSASWGGMLAASLAALAAGEWRPIVIPGVLILAAVGAFNVIAEALRARLDRAGLNAGSNA
jgi:peptide/nickel transport system permease protein